MEKFFNSRIAQVVSGAIVGFGFGIALKNAVVAFVGRKLFLALTSGIGLFTVLVIVIFTLFVGFTIFARSTHQGHN